MPQRDFHHDAVRRALEADFLGVPLSAYDGVLSSALGNVAVEEYDVNLVVVDVDKVRVERWRK
jgi:hypothetical protein